LGSDPRAFTRPQHRPPIISSIFFEQQNLKLPTGFGVAAAEPRRDHPRVVEHQNIASFKKGKKLVELTVLNLSNVALQDQQARLVSLGRR
jgi:hypothetical protein